MVSSGTGQPSPDRVERARSAKFLRVEDPLRRARSDVMTSTLREENASNSLRDPIVVPADGGETVFLVGDTYTTLLSGAHTGGAFTLCEATVPANAGPPPHIHHDADETFFMLEGRLTFRVGSQSVDASPGTAVFVPRGVIHSFANGGDPARMLFLYAPAGMEGMFAEIGAPGTRGVVGPPLTATDVEAMIAVADKYRYTILAP